MLGRVIASQAVLDIFYLSFSRLSCADPDCQPSFWALRVKEGWESHYSLHELSLNPLTWFHYSTCLQMACCHPVQRPAGLPSPENNSLIFGRGGRGPVAWLCWVGEGNWLLLFFKNCFEILCRYHCDIFGTFLESNILYLLVVPPSIQP